MVVEPRLRVAVAQLAYHPADAPDGRDPRDEPLFHPSAHRSSLDPPSGRPLPTALAADLADLRRRLRAAHDRQHLAKLRALVGACRRWRVRLLVLPAGSVPAELLAPLAEAAPDLLIIAGTHRVPAEAVDAALYAALACPQDQLPGAGDHVAPVLFAGRLLALPRAAAAAPDLTALDLPPETGLLGPLLVAVGPRRAPTNLAPCRLYVVLPTRPGDPSFSHAELVAQPAADGGTGLRVNRIDPRPRLVADDPFPDLWPGEEGLVVADLDRAAGDLTPFALANLTYRAHPVADRYATWLTDLDAALAHLPAHDDASFRHLVDAIAANAPLLRDAAALPGAPSRSRRLARLVEGLAPPGLRDPDPLAPAERLARLTHLVEGLAPPDLRDPESLARLTREVPLPAEILPFEHVRQAMALGASDALHALFLRTPDPALAELAHVLRSAAEPIHAPTPDMWSHAARRALAALRHEVADAPPAAPRPHPATSPLLPTPVASPPAKFVAPQVRIDGAPSPHDALTALDTWLAGDTPFALLTGDPGLGKSTLLAAWARRRANEGLTRRALIVPLRGATTPDPRALLLAALGRHDNPEARRHLTDDLRARRLVPLFDGLDEFAGARPDLLSADLLKLLLETGPESQILVSTRPSHPAADALARALPTCRIDLLPLDDARIAAMLPEGAHARLAANHQLRDAVGSPLVLTMAREVADALDPSLSHSAIDVYDAYFAAWPRHARREPLPAEPLRFAEALALALAGADAPLADDAAIRGRLFDLPPPVDDATFAALAALYRAHARAFIHHQSRGWGFTHSAYRDYFHARAVLRIFDRDPARARDLTAQLGDSALAFVHSAIRTLGANAPSIALAVDLGLDDALTRREDPESEEADAAYEADEAPVDDDHPSRHTAAPAPAAGPQDHVAIGDDADAILSSPDPAPHRPSHLAPRTHGADERHPAPHRPHATASQAPTPRPAAPAPPPAAHLARALPPVAEDMSQETPRSAPLRGPPQDRRPASDAPAGPPSAERSVDASPAPAPPPAHAPLDALLSKLALPAEPAPLIRKRAAREPEAPNRFDPGPPLHEREHLPGRDAILAELTALVDRASPVLLKGPRRAGKSSLLYTLQHTQLARRPVLRATLDHRVPRTPDDFACLVDPDLQDTRAPADRLWRRLESAEVRPAVLLDEIAWLTRADESLFPWLRALGQERLAGLVYAGTHADWIDVIRHANRVPGSSFGNDVSVVELGPLAQDDALAFLLDTSPADARLDPERSGRWIVDLSGGWPFYLQVLGYAAVEEARQGKRGPLVDRAAMIDLYERRLLRERVAVFRSRWGDLRRPAQEVMLAVLARMSQANTPLLPSPRELARRERTVLSDAGLLDAQRGWLLDGPFRDWLLRNVDELEVSDAY